MAAFLYEFEWDSAKARTNFAKHGVAFERAVEVFRDPLAVTIPHDEHSVREIRWITLGMDARGQRVLFGHTFEQISESIGRVRVVSTRRSAKAETRDYEELR